MYVNELWTLYNKKAWLFFNGSTTKGERIQKYHKQALCIKLGKGASTLIKYQVRQWFISGKLARSFGDYVKVVEVVAPKIPPGQAKITVGMNSHIRSF